MNKGKIVSDSENRKTKNMNDAFRSWARGQGSSDNRQLKQRFIDDWKREAEKNITPEAAYKKGMQDGAEAAFQGFDEAFNRAESEGDPVNE